MAGTMCGLRLRARVGYPMVSMESGLDGRNNLRAPAQEGPPDQVSMESGLDGRNNDVEAFLND